MGRLEVFYTIATDYECSQAIFRRQMDRLQRSGLAEAMSRLTIVVAGETDLEVSTLPFADKLVVLTAVDPKRAEVTTLFELLRRSQDDDFGALYFHSKGCTHGLTHEPVQDWCELLEYFLIDHWKEAIKRLDGPIDTVGVNWSTWLHPHYSGNFWWAKSSYLRSLPNPNDQSLAFYCEYNYDDCSLEHEQMLARRGFDGDFVTLTFEPGCTLEVVPNLSTFIEVHGFDWLWYRAQRPELHPAKVEQVIEHWSNKEHRREFDDYRLFCHKYRRISAETWIMRGAGNHHSLYNSNCCHYLERFPPSLYRSERRIVAIFFPRGGIKHSRYQNTPSIEYRIYLNFLRGQETQLRETFTTYWHATFTHLETRAQMEAFVTSLREEAWDEVRLHEPLEAFGR